MNFEPSFFKCEPRNIDELIEGLSQQVKEFWKDKDTLPRVHFLTGTGQTISGRLYQIKSSSSGKNLMIFDGEHLTYVPLRAIMSVTIEKPELLIPFLSQGEQAFAEGTEPIGGLVIRRQVEQIQERIKAESQVDLGLVINFDDYPKDDAVNLNLNLLLEVLTPAIQQICSDSMGQKAMTSVSKLKFCHGERWSVERQENSIVVTLDLTKALPNRLKEKLVEDINQIF